MSSNYPEYDYDPDTGQYGPIYNEASGSGLQCATCSADLSFQDLDAYSGGMNVPIRCSKCVKATGKKLRKDLEDLDRLSRMLEDDDEEGDD